MDTYLLDIPFFFDRIIFICFFKMDTSQKVVSPLFISSFWDIVIIFMVVLIGLTVNKKYLTDLVKDDKELGPNSNGILIKDITFTHTKLLMIYIPTYLILIWCLHDNIHVPEWFMHLMCYEKHIILFFRIYFGLTSLIIACLRYIFIVHHDKVLEFGVSRTKKVFYYAHLVIPMILAGLYACIPPNPSTVGTWNARITQQTCQKSVELSSTKVNFDENHNATYFIDEHLRNIYWDELIYPVTMVVRISIIVILSNVLEGLFYWRTFSRMKR